MTRLEDARNEFWDAWNGLSEVHTQEDLESQSKKMEVARKRLLKVDSEFRAMIKAREEKANAVAEINRLQIKNKHETIRTEAEADSKSIISAANAKVNAAMRMSEADLDDLVQKYRFKAMAHEKAEAKSKLVCPICHDPDRGNIINGNSACFKCLHKLVPISELEEYNRQYRRKWKKSRKR